MTERTMTDVQTAREEELVAKVLAAFADTPDGFSTAKCSFSVPSPLGTAQTYASDSQCGTSAALSNGRVATLAGTSVNLSA